MGQGLMPDESNYEHCRQQNHCLLLQNCVQKLLKDFLHIHTGCHANCENVIWIFQFATQESVGAYAKSVTSLEQSDQYEGEMVELSGFPPLQFSARKRGCSLVLQQVSSKCRSFSMKTSTQTGNNPITWKKVEKVDTFYTSSCVNELCGSYSCSEDRKSKLT